MSLVCVSHTSSPSLASRHGSTASLGLYLLGSWFTPVALATTNCSDPSSEDERPFPTPPLAKRRPPSDANLMGRIAASLRFSPLPVLAVAGIANENEGQNFAAPHRASYHGGAAKYELNGFETPNHQPLGEHVIGSAENLVGRVLQEQGLGRYCEDADFVRATQRELAEAINLSPEELDRAAHRLMSLPHDATTQL